MIKNLFQTFQKSIYSPAFYRVVAVTPLRTAFHFYAKMSFVLALFMTLVFSVILVPQGVRFIKEEAPALVKKYYPADLVITIDKGVASSNVVEPYMISTEGNAKTAVGTSTTENLLVIDTKNDFTKKKFDEYKTFTLLTKGEVVTQNNRGQITIQDLRGAPNMVISQETLLAWVGKIRGSLDAFVPAGIFITFLIIVTGFALYLIPVLLFALIPLFIAWIQKTPLSYASAYKMSLYAVVPGLVLKSLLNVSGIFFVPAYLTFLIFMLVIFINMREIEQPTLFEGK
jgi:hypothetical protein